MGPRVEAKRVQKNALDKMKGVKDFHYMQWDMNTETADKQQPKEQNRKLGNGQVLQCSTLVKAILGIW